MQIQRPHLLHCEGKSTAAFVTVILRVSMNQVQREKFVDIHHGEGSPAPRVYTNRIIDRPHTHTYTHLHTHTHTPHTHTHTHTHTYTQINKCCRRGEWRENTVIVCGYNFIAILDYVNVLYANWYTNLNKGYKMLAWVWWFDDVFLGRR